VVTCSGDSSVKIWNPSNATWSLIQTYTAHTSYVSSIEFINSYTIASGSYDQTIQIWLISSGQLLRNIYADSFVFCLKLLSNGMHLVAGLFSSMINIYDIKTGDIIFTLSGHQGSVNDLALIRKNGNDLLASSSQDKTIRLWSLTLKKAEFILEGHTGAVFGLKLMNADLLASVSYDKNIILWNVTNGVLLRRLTGHSNYLEYSIDKLNEKTVVSGSMDKSLKLWDWSTGKCLKTIQTRLDIQSLAVLK